MKGTHLPTFERPPESSTDGERDELAWWERLHNMTALAEIAELTEEETAFIEKRSLQLAAAVKSWVVSASKSFAPNASGQYESFLLAGEGGNMMTEVVQVLNKQMPPSLRACFSGEQTPVDFNTLIVLRSPQDPETYILRVRCIIPIGALAADKERRTRSEHTILLRRGEFTDSIKNGHITRLFPFILKAAALNLNEARSAFFDGSFGGERVYQKGNSNKIVGLFPDLGACLIYEDPADSTKLPDIVRGEPDTIARVVAGTRWRGDNTLSSDELLGSEFVSA